MIGFTLHHIRVGTMCISLAGRFVQPVITLQSHLYTSYAFSKLIPVKHIHLFYTKKGDSAVCQRRLKFLQTECITSFLHINKLPLQSWNNYQSLSVLRTSLLLRNFATNGDKHTKQSKSEELVPEKLSLLQRFKQMYRDYWYVLVPVHLVTSLGWFGGFYYLTKSGVDVIALLESMGISDKVINPLRDSSAGYIALAYALYKIATPLRYTVTLGGTTISINYLKKWGYIRPIPPREKLKEMYQEKKATVIREATEELRFQQEKLKKTRENMMRGYRERTGKPEK